MKIGIDARSMFGTPTGVGRYLSNLLTALSRLDFENTYWLYTDRQVEKPIIAQANFFQKALTLPVAQNYFTWNHLRLPPELILRPVDVFHFPFYTMPVFRNYKSIVTIHDITYEVHPEWYSWKGLVAMRLFSRYAAQHADTILTDSHSTKADIVRHYRVPEKTVEVISLGVEEQFRKINKEQPLQQIKARYQIRAMPIILYIGSIHTRRNVEELIRAFQIIARKHRESQLVIVGKREYPYLDVQTLIHELGLAQQVLLPGYVPDDDLPGLYNLADLFIYPSSYEGFGLPPLEAMACGTPVITSNNTSLPEVTGDAAILLDDPRNVNEIADAIEQVLRDEGLRQKMITCGLVRARQFSWEQTARKTLAVYRKFEREG